MKKVFSLLLVVAMLVSLSLVASAAPANEAGGMHTVITETDTDITVDVYVNNVVKCSGVTSYIVTDAVTYVEDSVVVGENFVNATLTPTTNKAGYIKFALAFTAAEDFFTEEGSALAVSYKVEKVDANATLSAADFSYSTSTIKVSKITTATGATVAGVAAGNNFTTAKQPAYFTIDYVDAKAPIVVDGPLNDEGVDNSVASTLTFYGRIGAEWFGEAYGIIIEGKDFFGAQPGDVVANGVAEFNFADFNGEFEIVLTNITEKGTAGEKTYQFFVGDYITEEATVVVE